MTERTACDLMVLRTESTGHFEKIDSYQMTPDGMICPIVKNPRLDPTITPIKDALRPFIMPYDTVTQGLIYKN